MRNKQKLQLSYSSPNYWWNRTLPVNSKEWKKLRKLVLERDNYTCNFCQIMLSKYMVVDHIDGDGRNNNIDNLRLNCPACDKIRHCGLAGLKKQLIVGLTEISQVEIIQKTVEFYRRTKKVIEPRELDNKVKTITSINPVMFVGKPEYKGFFTNEMNFSYLKFILCE